VEGAQVGLVVWAEEADHDARRWGRRPGRQVGQRPRHPHVPLGEGEPGLVEDPPPVPLGCEGRAADGEDGQAALGGPLGDPVELTGQQRGLHRSAPLRVDIDLDELPSTPAGLSMPPRRPPHPAGRARQ
jgi:hypothetical protein